MSDLTYCIVTYPASSDQYTAAIEEESTVRTSLDGLQCVLKWAGGTPPSFDGLPTLTHSEALALMQTIEWQEDNIPG
jgi:hypothetical protein